MKNLMVLRKFALSFCTAITIPVTAIANTCLQQASNYEILDELNRRLSGGSGGGGGEFAIASYTCSRYGDLEVTVVNSTSQATKVSVDVGNQVQCSDQAGVLNQYRTRIRELTIIGVCGRYGDLDRYSLLPNGSLKKIGSIDVGNQAQCIMQAKKMNSAT
jgi:hypothetical protein